MALTEDDVVVVGRQMLAEENADPQQVTKMFARFESKIDGKRTPYDPDWWDKMTAPPSPPTPLRTRRRSSTRKRT